MLALPVPDEIGTATEPEPVPVVEKPLRSRGKTPVTVRNSSRRSSKVSLQVQLYFPYTINK